MVIHLPFFRVFQVDAFQSSSNLSQVPSQQVTCYYELHFPNINADNHMLGIILYTEHHTRIIIYAEHHTTKITSSMLHAKHHIIGPIFPSCRNMRKLVIGFTVFVMSLSCLVRTIILFVVTCPQYFGAEENNF